MTAHRFLLLLYFTSCLLTVRSQSVTEYHIRQYTTDNGMPSNGVKNMQWDEENGFLWIATEAGMSRYNGMDFTNFTKENTAGLSHERMAYVVKNDRGQLFVSDVSNNILQVKANKLQYLPTPEADKVIGFKKRFYLNYYGCSQSKKILSFILKTGNTGWDRVFRLTDSSILVVDNRRNYYYSRQGEDSFYQLTLDKKFIREFMINEQVFFEDENHQYWTIDTDFNSLHPVTLQSDIQSILKEKDAWLYWDIGMESPIVFSGTNAWLLDMQDGKLQAELICTAIPSYSFIRFAQYSRKNKMLFLGTDSKGVIIINENRVRSVKKKNTDMRERNAYYSQLELPGGNVLTNEGHILGDGPVPDQLPVNGKFNYSITRIGDSLWYAQTSTGLKGQTLLHRYNYKTGETLIYKKLFPIQESFAIARSDDSLFLVTSRGLGFLKDDSIQMLFHPPATKENIAAPYTMQEFTPGVLGVASCDGLILYDVKKKTTDTLLLYP